MLLKIWGGKWRNSKPEAIHTSNSYVNYSGGFLPCYEWSLKNNKAKCPKHWIKNSLDLALLHGNNDYPKRAYKQILPIQRGQLSQKHDFHYISKLPKSKHFILYRCIWVHSDWIKLHLFYNTVFWCVTDYQRTIFTRETLEYC